MHRHATWIAVAALVAAGCGSDRPAGPPRLGARADVKALTAALTAVVAAPADARAAHLAAAVAAQCGPACACLTPAPGAPGCPAANASVPAGWPALELTGRYLREQLELATGRDRDGLAAAVAQLVVPVARIDATTLTLAPATAAVRPLSVAPIVLVAADGTFAVARHPVVTFDATGAVVADPPAPTPANDATLTATLTEAAGALGTRPAPPAPPPDAGVVDPDGIGGGLLGTDPDPAGGFGFGRAGFGPGGGTGWGTIGTGRYGTIGGGYGRRFELHAFPVDRAALTAGQPVIAAAAAANLDALIAVLGNAGGAFAVTTGPQVAELAWSVRAARSLDRVTGISLVRDPNGLALASDGTPLVTWSWPLSPTDRAALAARLAQLPAAATAPLTIEAYDITAGDVIATLELAAPLASQVTLVLRRAVATYGVGHGGGLNGGGAPSGPQVRIGIPQSIGDLDKAIIRRYIKRNILKITYCYEKALLATPDLEGTVTTQFFISPTGAVSTASATGVSPEVASCVAGVIKGIEFPKPRGGGGVQVNYPFRFSPAP